MHPEAFGYVAKIAGTHGPFRRVVDIGGRNINGTVRDLFPAAEYTAVDIVDGPGVDVVADAQTWQPPGPVDLIVCCEVLEHVETPERFIDAAWKALCSGGRLILTAACPPRAPHSGMHGGPVETGEWYRNVNPYDLATFMTGWEQIEMETHEGRGDVYVTGVRP